MKINKEELKKEIQKNLLNWYPFQKSQKVLYIGNFISAQINLLEQLSWDEITKAKINDAYMDILQEREVDLSIMDIHELNEEQFAHIESTYDIILCIAYLELLPNPQELLSLLTKMITPKGHLLLGMNNRLGIRYFCGDRDPYTDRNFDSIEDYKRAYLKQEDAFHGRCYCKDELRTLLENAGWKQTKFYSVFSDLQHPSMLVAENYKIHADELYSIIPCYNNPDTLFLEEENLYPTLIKENLLHKMANAFFIDCTMDGVFSDILLIKTAMDSKKEDAVVTVFRNERDAEVKQRESYQQSFKSASTDLGERNIVQSTINSFVPLSHLSKGLSWNKIDSKKIEKIAISPEGKKKLEKIMEYSNMLKERGLLVLDIKLENDGWSMSVCKSNLGNVSAYPLAVTYLKELLRTDKERFFAELDRFCNLIFQSSDLIKEDKKDGKGAILEHGFFDLTPSNCYYMDGEFVFAPPEFCVKNYPANALLLRVICCLYQGDMEMIKYLPMDILMERYGLNEKKELWWRADWWFSNKYKNRHVMWKYYEKVQKNHNVLNSNRQRINYNTDDYQRLFIDIFKNADTRKLILFGSGLFTKKFLDLYKDSYPVYAIIDNNQTKWGTEMEGIPIHSPKILKEFQSGEYKVIICIKNYLSVMKQLDALGVGDYSIYDWNKDYPRRLNPIAGATCVESDKPKKYNIGYVAGVFDMFHVGHINLLRKAKEQCNYLIVAVVPDETVFKQKNKYPVIPCEDRVEVLKACRYADQVEVLPLDYAGIRDAYKMFHFDCQFSGDDHSEEEGWLADKEFLQNKGADIVFFGYTQKVSSTKLRAQLQEK